MLSYIWSGIKADIQNPLSGGGSEKLSKKASNFENMNSFIKTVRAFFKDNKLKTVAEVEGYVSGKSDEKHKRLIEDLFYKSTGIK